MTLRFLSGGFALFARLSFAAFAMDWHPCEVNVSAILGSVKKNFKWQWPRSIPGVEALVLKLPWSVPKIFKGLPPVRTSNLPAFSF
jgi:hypothetical protein